MQIVLNDFDRRVSDWWSVIASTDDDEFRALLFMLDTFVPTVDLFYKIQKAGLDPTSSVLIRAYAGIFLNRCSFSGALSAGPIGGRGQKSEYSVDCRWNPAELRKRHLACRELLSKHRVSVRWQDFRDTIKSIRKDWFIYADPPYRRVGQKNYPAEFGPDEHEDLSTILLAHPGNWLLSYDDVPWVRERYANCEIIPVENLYTMTSKRKVPIKGKELLIRPR
jgi:DNA adenine methylase